MKLQKTIKTEVSISGKGLFSGCEVTVVFKPAEPDTGIMFIRADLDDPVEIPATARFIAERDRRSALVKGPAVIETPEHCLAAIRALDIDNIYIEMDNYELPGFDGSSDDFFRILKKTGTVEQKVKRNEFVITEPVSITEGDKAIYALPYKTDNMNITYDLDYSEHKGIGRQFYTCELTESLFDIELSLARTFCLEEEAKQMQAMGIGEHLTPKDILVIDSNGPIKNNYRYDNECARHKVVDLIGDLTLVGKPIVGRVVAYKTGHNLNQRLAKSLFKMSEAADRKAKATDEALLDIRRIQKVLPHRYPFLLVDKVLDVEDGNRIIGVKNVTYNEQFFQGHFPGTPIMPGVLIVEALAQVSGLLFSQKLEHTGKLAVILSMDKVKIRKAVVPGDQLFLISETKKVRGRTAKCNCFAKVGQETVAQAMLTFMLVDDDIV